MANDPHSRESRDQALCRLIGGFINPIGQDKKQPGLAQIAADIADEFDRALIRPVNIFEHQEERLRSRKPQKVLENALE